MCIEPDLGNKKDDQDQEEQEKVIRVIPTPIMVNLLAEDQIKANTTPITIDLISIHPPYGKRAAC